MNQTQKKILSQFSPELRNHIIEFCKVISKIECDVFMLLARKAACLISVLEDCGMLTLNGKVVSERVLDYDTDWLRGKKVVIIDDTIISGTSIHQIVASLDIIGVANLKVHVFCVNKYWFVNELLEVSGKDGFLQKPYLTLDHTTSLKFCRDIVRALSIYPRPYSTDFPIYESIRITEKDFHELQTLSAWKITDTTSSLQHEFDIHSFSMNPGKAILKEFYDNIGLSLVEYSFLKIRIYAQRFERKGQRIFYLCRALPLVIFNPISNDLLQQLVISICTAEKVDSDLVSKQMLSNKAKLRFVQFYFANYFLQFALKKAEGYFKKKYEYFNNDRELELIFPPFLVSIVESFSFTSKLKLNHSEFRSNFLSNRDDSGGPTSPINPLIAKDLLLSEFLNLYYNKELVARRIVKDIKREAFTDERYIKTINRLNEGLTFGDLKSILEQKIKISYDKNLILSNFLDNAIDTGIIVPVTLETDGYTSRGYRHGEEVIWGENNDKLLAIFYKKFLEASKLKDLPKFWFEKLLVLFLKMGLKGGILEEYNYSTPPPSTISLIGVRSYLYGQVSIFYELKPKKDTHFNPILDYEVKGYWNSSRLEDIGVLKLNDAERYEIDTDQLFNLRNLSVKLPDEPEDLDQNFVNATEDIAEILAVTRRDNLLNADGLVLLTSCLTIHDCISSIGAELYIFSQNVEKVLNWIRSAHSRSTININFLISLRDNSKNLAWTSVNSGREKYKAFIGKRGELLVKQVSEKLGKLDGFKKRVWDKYWNQEVKSDAIIDPYLRNLNDEMGLVLTELDIVMIYCQEIIFEFCNRNGTINSFQAELTNRKEKIQKEKRALETQISEIGQINKGKSQFEIDFLNAEVLRKLDLQLKTVSKNLDSTSDQIKYWVDFSSDNLKRINTYASDYIEILPLPPSINAIIVNINTGFLKMVSEEALSNLLYKIVDDLKNLKGRCDDLLMDFSSLVPQWGKINSPVRYGSVIHVNTSETSGEKRKLLANIVKKVIADFEIEEFGEDSDNVKSTVILRPVIKMDNVGYFIGGKGQFKMDRLTKLSFRLLVECTKSGIVFSIHFVPVIDEKNRVNAFYNKTTNQYDEVHQDFFSFFNEMESQCKNIPNNLVIFSTPEGPSVDHLIGVSGFNSTRKLKIESHKYKLQSGHNALYHQFEFNPVPSEGPVIGVLTALQKEFAAMRSMIDIIDDSFSGPADDPNNYVSGWIKSKKGSSIRVILAVAQTMGTNMAAVTAANMLRSFPSIDDIIMTGIAGGVPFPSKPWDHVRLGDIVVSDKKGVLQYDNIKENIDHIDIRDVSSKPSARLLGVCNLLEADRLVSRCPWDEYINSKSEDLKNFGRPSPEKDILRIGNVVVKHPDDENRKPEKPRIFFGPIGSSNTLLKNEKKRDYLRDTYGIKAVEMEGSGIADGTWQFSKGYLVVRGICDYGNSDKNDDWQNYAALCAAAYTKSIIEML